MIILSGLVLVGLLILALAIVVERARTRDALAYANATLDRARRRSNSQNDNREEVIASVNRVYKSVATTPETSDQLPVPTAPET